MNRSPRIVVLGAHGQVGSSLIEELGETGVGITRNDADITNKAALYRAFDNVGPISAIINAAAYTDVERAESERELAFAVNADAPGWAAVWAVEHNTPFVHFSTEYVFPDGSDHHWREYDATGPLNAYGESKCAGELAVRDAHADSVIIRTSWVYSEQTGNFVHKVLNLAASSSSLTVVSDQVGRPTFAPGLARAAIRISQDSALRSRIKGGILHLAGGEAVNRSDFARAIIDVGVAEGVLSHAVPVVDTTSGEYVTSARRPLHCVLDIAQAEALGLQLGGWEDSLSVAVRAARQ
jgi:dTDP-4-dehydrorhamnose reductase